MGDFNQWNAPHSQFGVLQDNTLEFQHYNANTPDAQDYMNAMPQTPITSFDAYQYGGAPKNIYPNTYDDEPPLLEELEIEPDKIIKRMLLILDPFRSCIQLEEYDLIGPIILCTLLPSILLLSAKAYFSHVIGFGVLCSFLMYCLLNVMSTHPVAATTIVSILGYGLLPQIVLAIIGIIMPLYSVLGFGLAILCVLWSSYATSRIFTVMMSSAPQQVALIAYPCALLYSVFTLLVLF